MVQDFFASRSRRTGRRPLRPPWRNRFSFGRASFGGRSFLFTISDNRGARKRLARSHGPRAGDLASAPLSGMTRIGLTVRESEFAEGPHAASYRPAETARPLGLRFRALLGKALWARLHGSSYRWPCARCRPTLIAWTQGLHDAVNVRLGKRSFAPEAFARFSSGSLDGPYHRGCVGCRLLRRGFRLLARVPRRSMGGAP